MKRSFHTPFFIAFLENNILEMNLYSDERRDEYGKQKH